MSSFLVVYGKNKQKEVVIKAKNLKEAEEKANRKYKTWIDIYKMKGERYG